MSGVTIPFCANDAKFGDVIARQASALHGADEAIAFLRDFDPRGRHNLVAINPASGLVEGQTFEAGDWANMRSWIAARDGRANLYFTANEPIAGAPHGKLQKHHIAKVRAVFGDIDPDKTQPLAAERQRLRVLAGRLMEGQAAPSFVIDSGGGIQPIWRFRDDLDPAQFSRAVEDQGRGIAFALGGDAVQNIDRILRLPGTTNIPSAAKRAAGRTETPAVLLASTGELHSLEDVAAQYMPRAASETADSEKSRIAATMRDLDMATLAGCTGYEDLPADLRRRFDTLLARDEKLRRLWAGDAGVLGDDTSGSAYRAKLAAALGRAGGFTAEEYGALVWVWDCSVQPGDDREAKLSARAIARDWERIAAPASNEALADEYFVFPQEQAEPLFPTAAPETKPSGHFPLLDIEELLNRPDPKFLIDRHLPEGSLGLLFGEPGCGKSFIALDMALHVAYRRPDWHGDKIEASGDVVYIAGEGVSGFKSRIAAWQERHNIRAGTKAGFRLIPQAVAFSEPEQVQRLIESIRSCVHSPLALVIIDTISRAIPGADENLQKDMSGFVDACGRVQREFGCAVLGIHHAGKQGDLRGSTVIPGAADFIFRLQRQKGAAVGRLECVKEKDAPDGWSEPYRFDLVPLPGGQSSLVPTRCMTTGAPDTPLTPAVTSSVMAAIKEAWDAGRPWGRTYHADDRMAERRMIADFGFSADGAAQAIKTWIGSGLIEDRIVNKKTKRKGLYVVGRIDPADTESGVFD